MSAMRLPPRRYVVIGICVCIAAFLALAHQTSSMKPSAFSAASTYYPTWGRTPTLGQGEPIVFSLIVYGNETVYETDILVKTILMYTSSPVDFHLIADPVSQAYLETSFGLIHTPTVPIRIFFYPLSTAAMLARLRRTASPTPEFPRYGELGSAHQAGTPGMMKLFIHEILPTTIPRAMFVDSDAFFLTDPTHLWREFNTWSPEHMLALPMHLSMGKLYNGTSNLCSCIYLMNLDNMRKNVFMDSQLFRPAVRARALSNDAMHTMYGPPTHKLGLYSNIGLGDQTLFWAISQFRPEFHKGLPLNWEVTSCLMDWYGTGLADDARTTEEEQIKKQWHLDKTDYDGTLITPGILHFNCMYGRTYMESPFFNATENKPFQKWGYAVRYHQKYKWIWLNRGQLLNVPPIAYTNVTDLRFWDERISGVIDAEGYDKKT